MNTSEYKYIQLLSMHVLFTNAKKCDEEKKIMKTSLSQVVNQTLLHAKSTDNDMQLKCVKATV